MSSSIIKSSGTACVELSISIMLVALLFLGAIEVAGILREHLTISNLGRETANMVLRHCVISFHPVSQNYNPEDDQGYANYNQCSPASPCAFDAAGSASSPIEACVADVYQRMVGYDLTEAQSLAVHVLRCQTTCSGEPEICSCDSEAAVQPPLASIVPMSSESPGLSLDEIRNEYSDQINAILNARGWAVISAVQLPARDFGLFMKHTKDSREITIF